MIIHKHAYKFLYLVGGTGGAGIKLNLGSLNMNYFFRACAW